MTTKMTKARKYNYYNKSEYREREKKKKLIRNKYDFDDFYSPLSSSRQKTTTQ